MHIIRFVSMSAIVLNHYLCSSDHKSAVQLQLRPVLYVLGSRGPVRRSLLLSSAVSCPVREWLYCGWIATFSVSFRAGQLVGLIGAAGMVCAVFTFGD
jgi:hypothetical protein